MKKDWERRNQPNVVCVFLKLLIPDPLVTYTEIMEAPHYIMEINSVCM